MKRKSIVLFIIAAAVIGILVIVFETLPIKAIEGTCGENVTWRLQRRTLTISGTGAMTDYSYDTVAPWYSRRYLIKRVIIHDGVTSIGNDAFDKCRLLRSVTIPNSVTSIGNFAFSLCQLLHSITIPNSVSSIGHGAFFYCTSLKSITIPNHITTIPRSAFDYCSHLQSINLPHRLLIIEENAFNGCTRLTDIHIPRSVKYIGECAFQSCESLNTVCIPNSVQSIGKDAFWFCQRLSSITIPESVKEIGDSVFPGKAFACCPQLTIYTASSAYINIPTERIVRITQEEALTRYNRKNNAALCGEDLEWILEDGVLTIVGTGKMYDYTNDNPAPWYNRKDSIQKVVVSDGVTSIGNNAFRWCENLTTVSISKSVDSIGETAFNYCRHLSSINIPQGLTYIGEFAFNNCISLQSITIPKSVKKIESYAFNSCGKLRVYTFSSVNMSNMGIRPDQIVYSNSSSKAKQGTKGHLKFNDKAKQGTKRHLKSNGKAKQGTKGHLKFNGEEIKGKRSNFYDTVLKGMIAYPTKEDDHEKLSVFRVSCVYVPEEEIYCDCSIGKTYNLYVYGTPKTDIVYEVIAVYSWSPYCSWSDIKKFYLSQKKKFTNEYGKPIKVVEKFEAPYSETNKPIEAFSEKKVQYSSGFRVKDVGVVSLAIENNLLLNTIDLIVRYFDEDGMQIYDSEK